MLIFDVNDFDEAFVGHFTWDLQRFAASVALMCWQKALSDEEIDDADRRRSSARTSEQVRWFIEVEDDSTFSLNLTTARGAVLLGAAVGAAVHPRADAGSHDARSTKSTGASGTCPACVDSTMPNATRSCDAFDRYLETIPETKRFRGITYDIKDVIGKTGMGIGSAGLPAYTVLIEGFNQALDNDVVLSMKQGNVAAPSRVVDDPDVHEYFKHHGHRTAVSQRALQAHADPLLGYTDIDGVGFVVSEISPYEADLDWSELTEPDELAEVIEQLGQAVAKVHCVSDTDSDQIAGRLPDRGRDRRGDRRRRSTISSPTWCRSGWSTPRSCATTIGTSSRRSARAGSPASRRPETGLSRRRQPKTMESP